MSKNKNKISSDVNKLLADADALLNELLSSNSLSKSEYKKTNALKKRGAMCKDEDEEKDNQDAIFYENQSPEVKDDQDDQQEEKQDQQQEQEQDQEQQQEYRPDEQQEDQQKGQFKEDEEEIDPVQLIQSLDDDALAELYEQIKQEYMARMANKESKEQDQEDQQQQVQELKMSENFKKVVEQKDRQIADLTKSVTELLDLVEKLASRPISKAHSGLNAVPSLQKNEKIDLRKSVMDIINNPAKLYKLSSQEASILVDYYSGQKYKNLEEMTVEIVKKVL